MTKSEAAGILEKYTETFEGGASIYESLKMAVDALKDEVAEECGLFDCLDAQKTGGSKDRIEFTVEVKADKVMDFTREIKTAVLDEVLEIIDSRYAEYLTLAREGVQPTANMLQNSIREDVFALRGDTE